MDTKRTSFIVMTAIIFAFSLTSCSGDKNAHQLDPTLLPTNNQLPSSHSITAQATSDAPAPDPSSITTAPIVNNQSLDHTIPVEELQVGSTTKTMPTGAQIPAGATVYPQSDQSYLIASPQDQNIVQSIISDTEKKIDSIPQSKDTKEQIGITSVWLQDISLEMSSATNLTPVFVYSMDLPLNADSKENSTVWTSWVLSDNTINYGINRSTEDEAIRDAKSWIKNQDNPDSYVIVSR